MPTHRCSILFVVVATAVIAATGARADTPPDAGPAGQASAASEKKSGPAKGAPGSPRASLQRFYNLGRRGDFKSAGGFLEPAPELGDPATLARRLTLVLDRYLAIDLSRVSGAAASGTTVDVGVIHLDGGLSIPIRLVRTERDAGVRWLFSRATVDGVDEAYATLPHRSLLERMPDVLLRVGPREALWYQWLLLPLVILLSFAVGWVISKIARAVLKRLTVETSTHWDDNLAERLGGPINLGLTVAFAFLFIPWLDMPARAQSLVEKPFTVILLLALFWGLARSVDVTVAHLVTTWGSTRPSSKALLPLGGRITKVAVVAVGAVTIVSSLGYPVASILAGLGIGGLAVALAAQKTFENLLGAFAIGIDQPFREGDFVHIDDFVGTIESIGLRSTRIRTLDRTLIAIPNGQLAEKRLESFAERDRIRLFVTLGVLYETSATQMRGILADIIATLRANPKVWPDAVIARFAGFGASSLDVEVMCWFNTTDYDEFCALRTATFLQFMEVVEKHGSGFAFPTRTLHFGSGAPFPVVSAGTASGSGDGVGASASAG